ncbi:MAG: hypothetical protein PHI89_08895, partial [Thiovulaceae bacterium]|nr:hypothetical protein [Sulfurimonadaceae bacterium]
MFSLWTFSLKKMYFSQIKLIRNKIKTQGEKILKSVAKSLGMREYSTCQEGKIIKLNYLQVTSSRRAKSS